MSLADGIAEAETRHGIDSRRLRPVAERGSIGQTWALRQRRTYCYCGQCPNVMSKRSIEAMCGRAAQMVYVEMSTQRLSSEDGPHGRSLQRVFETAKIGRLHASAVHDENASPFHAFEDVPSFGAG